MGTYKLLLSVAILAVSNSSLASSQIAAAGIVKTDQGTYKMVVLVPGEKSMYRFCESEWDYGFIQNWGRLPTSESYVDMPICWAASSIDPSKGVINFKYMNPATGKIIEFSSPASRFNKFRIDRETGELTD